MTLGLDIIAIGEAMVEFNQAKGGDGRSYLQGFGGDTSNAMIAAARQGARCAYFTHVGDDEFGRLLLELWRAEGVDASLVGVHADAFTGIYFVQHGEQGHSFSYRRKGSAASAMTPADLPVEAIRHARFLHISGISQAISTSATDAVARAIAIARQVGVRVSYDPNLRLSLWSLERARAVLIETMAQSDEFLPSIDDLRLVCGHSQPDDILAWAHAHGARTVVLKLGSDGALVSTGGAVTEIAAHKVAALDATGAGDCFDGVYLARRAAGEEPVAAARWASAAAALATTGYGAVAPLPSRARVQELMESAE